jgi:hypothetical protein
MIKYKSFSVITCGLILFIGQLMACGVRIGQVVISEPDEYSHIYEAKEKYILRAIARVFKEKGMGSDVRTNEKKQTVETDFIVQGDWRTKCFARVKKLNWKECEVFLSVTTEKKTGKGWEMRRLLAQEQYTKIFDTIHLRVYEEMYKTE